MMEPWVHRVKREILVSQELWDQEVTLERREFLDLQAFLELQVQLGKEDQQEDQDLEDSKECLEHLVKME